MKTSITNVASTMIVLAAWGVSIMGFVGSGICTAGSLAQTDANEPAASSGWVPTGSLNIARSRHTATRLQNGGVLVAGGYSNTAELYNPALGVWSFTGSMSVTRTDHTATLLANGQVLVVGGDFVGSAEVYDPVHGTWMQTGILHTPRFGSSATLLQSGKVLVAGGFDNDGNELASAELYDPVTSTWSVTGSLHVARDGHTATRLPDGRVLVARGDGVEFAGDLIVLSSAELYDPLSGKWTLAPDSGEGSIFHTATLMADGEVLLTGGAGDCYHCNFALAASEQFDPVTQTWTRTGDLLAPRYGHAATLLTSGDVLISGGTSAIGQVPNLQYVTLASTERFDPTTATWSSASSLNTARSWHTATLLSDGRVLVAGGGLAAPYTDRSDVPLNSAELYVANATGAVDLNQLGLTGSWYEPTTSGQGLEVEVYPDLSPGSGFTQVSWFTFDTAAGLADHQRWYTLSGAVTSGQPNAALTIYQNTGGNFNAVPTTVAQAVGTATLSFATCTSGQLAYTFTDGTGRTGTIPLTRLTQNVTCAMATPFPTNADFALSGNWYDAATAGQGFTVEVNPVSGALFAAWYTYEPMGATSGAAGQRWYTAQASFTAGMRSIPVMIFETTGGIFNTAPPAGQQTVAVGTGTLAFQSCTAATFAYTFTAGSSSGLSGTITLSRVGPIPPGCTP